MRISIWIFNLWLSVFTMSNIKKIFKLLPSIIFIFCAIFFLSKPASASITFGTAYQLSQENMVLMSGGYCDYQFAIADCENSILIVDAIIYTSFSFDNAYWGSQEMTALGAYDSFGNIKHQKYYLKNPDPGINYLYLKRVDTSDQLEVGTAVQFCGVDLDNPFLEEDQDFYSGNDASFSLNTLEASSGDIFLGYVSRYKGLPRANIFTVQPPSIFLFDMDSDIGNVATAYVVATSSDPLFQYWNNADTLYGAYGGYVLLNPASGSEPTQPSDTNISLGDISCCENTECLAFLAYSADYNNTTIAWGVDLDNCNIFSAEQKNLLTLNLWTGQPTAFIASSTLSAGEHSLCFAWSNDYTSGIQVKNFDVMASTSSQCATMEVPTDWCDRDTICASTATSTSLWSGAECVLKMTGCWLFSPQPGSLDYLSDRFNAIKIKAPFSLYFDITDSIEYGFTQADDRSGSIGLPMWSATSSSYYFITVLDASSTEKAIGKTNSILFRNTQKWIIWTLVILIIFLFLTKK